MTAPLILVVAASDELGELAAMLERMGGRVISTDSIADAVSEGRARQPDLALVDVTTGVYDGFDAIARIRASSDRLGPVIAVTGLGDVDARRRAMTAGADDFVTRPLADVELQVRLSSALRLERLSQELTRVNGELAASTTADPLTALTNQRWFRILLDRELARARRYRRTLSLVIADVDSLHRFNDANDRAAGDRLLCDVADIIRAEIREPDLASRHDGAFWILAPETDPVRAHAMAERIRRAVNLSTPATLSLGIAAFPSASVAGVDQLIEQAMQALGRAKAAGRNGTRS